MNKLYIIGNLTRDPELRTTQGGKDVCTFTVAVNRRKTGNNQQPEADFFRVSAWDNLAKTCNQYLSKGSKVAVVGPVSVHTYTNQKGETSATLEVTANDVEFLSPKSESQGEQEEPPPAKVDAQTGMQQVDTDELPF
jgi:single-strand DNA-binding protein